VDHNRHAHALITHLPVARFKCITQLIDIDDFQKNTLL